MIPQKLVEAAFRNLWVLIIPIVVAPLLVVVLSGKPASYESTASVWVSRADGVQAGSLTKDASDFVTPAQAQVQVFYDLLSTRAFRVAIAVDAEIIPASAPEETQNIAANYVARSLLISASGTNLVTITATTPHAEESYAIAGSTIRQYQSRAQSETDRTNNTKLAYFKEQITEAERELGERRTALNAYVTANPSVINPLLTTYDAQYETLKAAYDQQNQVVTDLVSERTKIELEIVSSSQGLQTVFSVQDPPRFPSGPVATPVTQRFGFPIAGLVFGVLISAAYLYLVYRMDQTIRTAEDVEAVGVPLLGYVPEIQKGPGAGLWQYTPLGWLMKQRQRGYARKVAASLSTLSTQEGRA